MKILVLHYCLLDDVTIFLMERYSELKLDWLERRKKEKKEPYNIKLMLNVYCS